MGGTEPGRTMGPGRASRRVVCGRATQVAGSVRTNLSGARCDGRQQEPVTDGDPSPAPGGPSLRARAARGSAVTLATQLTRSLVLLGGTIVLARMVAPAEFGLIAMVV